MLGAFALLFVAIGIEVAATASLGRTDGFHEPVWSILVLGGYALSIWLLALVVARMPISVAYALWSGIGTAAIAVVGVLFLHESLSVTKVAALGMIIVGVVLLNLHTAH